MYCIYVTTQVRYQNAVIPQFPVRKYAELANYDGFRIFCYAKLRNDDPTWVVTCIYSILQKNTIAQENMRQANKKTLYRS